MSDKLDTLWYTRCPVPTALGIAVQNGWLDDAIRGQGGKVESLRESNDQAVRESHFNHTLKNSVRHGGNIPAIGAKALGRDTRVIGLSWADEVQLILTGPEPVMALTSRTRVSEWNWWISRMNSRRARSRCSAARLPMAGS